MQFQPEKVYSAVVPLVLLISVMTIYAYTQLNLIELKAFNARKQILTATALFLFGLHFYLIYFVNLKRYVLLIPIVFFPIINRALPYFYVPIQVDNFYFVSFESLYFAINSFLIFYTANNKNFRMPFLYLIFIIVTCLISSCLTMVFTERTDLELLYYWSNHMVPLLFGLSMIFYINTCSTSEIKVLASYIFASYIIILIFCLAELFFKGGQLFSNPMIVLQNGLRLGGSLTSDGYGASIISGGIRDMLYLGFILSFTPHLCQIWHYEGIINNPQKYWLLFISLTFIFLIASKTPIIMFFVNLFLAGGIKKRYLVLPVLFASASLLMIANLFLTRISDFVLAMEYILSGNLSLAKEAESSAAGRVITIINRFTEVIIDPFYPGSEVYLIDNSLLYIWSVYGALPAVLLVFLCILMFIYSNHRGRNILFAFILVSQVIFVNMVGAGGTHNILRFEYMEFVHVHAWWPVLVAGNAYYTIILFLFLYMYNILNKDAKIVNF